MAFQKLMFITSSIVFTRLINPGLDIIGAVGLDSILVKKIAEAYGGDITVSQNENKGVTFVVTLPRVM